ncbi:MAG TPA: ROK family protein [bacterium]|nr:ROK family protein [bacterium]
MKGYVAGIDLGGTKIYTAIASKKGDIIAEVKLPTGALRPKMAIFADIVRSVETACAQAGIAPSELAAIGIGVPGPIDYTTGVVRLCPNIPSWKKVPVAALLCERFDCPVRIENDARTAGLAEARCGAGKGFSHVFYTTVSTGIGGAIIIDGRIYHGASGVAGEIGQTRLPDGTVFEHSAAGPALKRLFGVAPEDIPALCEKRDRRAIAALDHLTRLIGIWIANVATLLNPEVIVIGGGLTNLGPCFFTPVKRYIKEYAFSESGKVKVLKAKLGGRSGVVGALELCR